MLLQQPPNPTLKCEGHLERPVVPLQLGERREADEVREQEGVCGVRHLGYHPVCKSDTERYVKF